MSFESATDQIISIVEDIPNSSLGPSGEYGNSFTHDPLFDPIIPETYPGKDLYFALLSPRGATDMRTKATASRRTFQDVVLAVYFPPMDDRRLQDVAIWRYAYPAIREAVFDVAGNWNRPTSGIVTLEPSAFEGAQAEAPVVDAQGARILSVLMALHYTNQTS